MTNYCKCGCETEIADDKTWVSGHNIKGVKHSDATREKIRESMMGHTNALGYKHTDAAKEKMIWREVSDVTREKIRESKMGDKNPMKNPATAKRVSETLTGHEVSDVTKEKIGESMENSLTHKIACENMKGGQDIINHHYIYDHNNLNKYTTKMTRSKHGLIHRMMQLAGIIVPHINIKEE